MAEVSTEEFLAHMRSLDDEDLGDLRFSLYDVAEGEPWDSDLHRSVRATLLHVDLERARRELFRGIRDAHRALGLPGDSEAFAEALPALIGASRELDLPLDPHSAFAGALEVAERRGQAAGSNDDSKGDG